MRKLSPPKAISHAISSVVTYRREALRIGMFWIPALFVLGLVRLLAGDGDPAAGQLDAPTLLDIASTALGLVAFSSMAVSWHRFILRDEHSAPWRLDRLVLRYIGNSLLIVVMAGVPMLIAVGLGSMVPALSILLLPLSLAAGTLVTALSVKLPAVALDRGDFTFRMAWEACKGSLWQVLGVFLLNAAIVLGIFFVVVLSVIGIGALSPAAGKVALLVADAVTALVVALLNASVFTSLYGFFVERRDF